MAKKNSNHISTSIKIVLALLLCALASMVGCGATQQANLWTDPSYHSAPLSKILVVAIRKDQLLRRMWEDALVTELNGKSHQGTLAIASYQLYPTDLPTPDEMTTKTKESGFDGVLLIAKGVRDTTTSDVPGYVVSEPTTTFSRRWGAYVTRYQDVYYPGYSESEVTVSVRTDLLIPDGDGKLVWSVTSQAVDPTSADQFRSSVADRVVSQLAKKRLIH
jgi:hypothetical protein